MELEMNKDPGNGRNGTVVLFHVLVGIGGAALLLWWALAFHRSDEQLWMVPVGLILLGTPVVMWFSVCASALCRRF